MVITITGGGLVRSYATRMGTDALKRGLGAAIRMRRAKENLGKEQFAQMIGINRLTLRKIETGLANPQLDILIKIAGGLNVPLSTLFAEGEGIALEWDSEE